MFEEGLVKLTFGVVSARIPKTDHIIITPSGFSKASVKTSELITVDTGGNVVDGILRPSVETWMHCYIHKNRPDVGAVLHTHSPIASGFASAHEEIPCVSSEQAFYLGSKVPLVEHYVMPGTNKKSDLESISSALKSSPAALLRNHGVVVIGENLEKALANAIVVEDAAKIALASKIAGQPRMLGDDEIKDLVELRGRYGQKKRS